MHAVDGTRRSADAANDASYRVVRVHADGSEGST